MALCKNLLKTLMIAAALVLGITTHAQVPGDEDKDMMNNAKARDQKAIEEAMNTWWTASMRTHEQRIQWWRDAKFGMFIHWGIYSLPGGEWKGQKVSGYAEHLMRKEKITRKEYLELAHQFNPVKFNAEEWVLNAKKAGMNYFIITAKHHDGFAMFDSEVSDFNVVKQTAWQHDPMADLAAACKKHGLKFGFYYSHAFDWEHPDAPGNDWEYKNPGGDLNLYGGRNWYDLHPELLRKAVKYVDEKAIPQIKELLRKYHPDILWFDTPQKLPLSENIRILKAIRETDPNVVVNGRLVRSEAANFGDYKNTGDRPAEFSPVDGDWEAIPTTNESYGYSKFDNSHKPVSFFIQLLAKAASRGGNLLMNIGPMGNSIMDIKDVNILKGIGKWVDKNKESIYGTGKSSLALQSWGVSTLKENKLYLHVFNWPTDGKLYVGGLKSVVDKAYLLVDPQKQLVVKRLDEKDLFINVTKQPADAANTVVVLELKNKISTDPTQYVATNVPLTRLLAFDATQHGKGLSYGDGKTDRYFVEGWKNKDQSLSWDIRASEDASYKVMIKYMSAENTAGEYKLQLDESMEFNFAINSEKTGKVITEELAKIVVHSGVHKITIAPVSFAKEELMKLLELQLIPVKD